MVPSPWICLLSVSSRVSPLAVFPHLQVGLHPPHAPMEHVSRVEMHCLSVGLSHKAQAP